jgi:two-component system sensor histidine kinase QseC
MTGHPLLLELALRNLVENAVSHTPRGTHVEVQLDAQQGWLQVGDDAQQAGRAPPKDSQAGAIRALGLGLGHRVVEKIAAIHGARFELVPQAGFSSCYRISFDPDRR